MIKHRPTAAPAPRQPAYSQPQYQPQFATQQQTQAIYAAAAAQQQQPRLAVKAQPIFSPAEPSRASPSLAALQSQLLQQQLYDEQLAAQPSYKNGPVQFGPAPVQESSQARAVHHQPQARSGGGGLLDQLARDYALPQGAAQPLHDISFGYY